MNNVKPVKRVDFNTKSGYYNNVHEVAAGEDDNLEINAEGGYLRAGTVDEHPLCCGIMNVGVLTSRRPSKSTTATFTKYITECLTRLASSQFEPKNKSCITVMITTNGRGDNILWEEMLSKCKAFTLVKEAKNINSGNTIKIWLSNN